VIQVNYEELLAFAGRNPMLSMAFVGLTELTQLMNAGGAVVVDLSSSSDFEKGHIAGSRNVQPAQFGPEHKLVANAKQSPVVLVCRTGTASETAAKALKKAGFEQVNVLDGGIPAWQQAELPLVKGRN
jgi:rhodanese-related sulfurtransferase